MNALPGTLQPVQPRVCLQRYKRLFSDTPEDSIALRLLALAASIWAAFGLAYVGVPLMVMVWTSAALTVGHYVSWRKRDVRILWISLSAGVLIVAAGLFMRNDILGAIRGDRIALAYFMLAAGAAASFDLRTRASLYTQLMFSGIVMFFASELAFQSAFGVLLLLYGVIVTGFLALAYLKDQTQAATVNGAANPMAPALLWILVGGYVAVASLGMLLVLPWNAPPTAQAAQAAIIPFGGDTLGADSGVTVEMARQMLESSSDSPVPGHGWAPLDGSSGLAVQGIDGWEYTSPPAWVRPLAAGGDEIGLVMHVRSPVLSYWRGHVYDTFDPDGRGGMGLWYSTGGKTWLAASLLAGRSGPGVGDRYLQTFFVETDLGGEVIAGYDPMAVAAPRDETGVAELGPGSTYQVLSVQPDLTAEGLRLDRARWRGAEYASIPPSFGPLHTLTASITGNAPTDFDRAAMIAAYLRNLEFDEGSTTQLVSNAPLHEFVYGETPGSSMDFATAMVLMARSAGLPARLATGYLPGEYNPYSGASAVVSSDAHAWAEIGFDGAGWVPFDAAPRPGLPAGKPAAGHPPRGLDYIMARRVGGTIAEAAGQAPAGFQATLSSLGDRLSHAHAALLLLVMGSVALAVLLYKWVVMLAGRARQETDRYTVLDGGWRAEVLAVFKQLEAELERRAVFRRRRPAESFRDYAEAVNSVVGGPESRDILWLAEAASRAAYSEALPAEDLRRLAAARMRSARDALKLAEPIG